MTDSYETASISYENETVSYESARVSYENAGISYETNSISYEIDRNSLETLADLNKAIFLHRSSPYIKIALLSGEKEDMILRQLVQLGPQ